MEKETYSAVVQKIERLDDNLLEFVEHSIQAAVSTQKLSEKDITEMRCTLFLVMGGDKFQSLTPIEQLMTIGLMYGVFLSFLKPKERRKFNFQSQVTIGPCRVDFTLSVGDKKPIVIECDGHDFHEKTKEQALRDKQRDRYLVANGYRVLHFTGSEIWKNPASCTIEAVRVAANEPILKWRKK